MEIGVGLDASLGLTFDDQASLSQEAARLGYTNIWTPEGAGQDSFQLCAQRWAASREVTPGGLTTGIAVSPVMYRTPVAFAMSGGTLSQMTGGRFLMGIGSGGAYRPRTRQSLGLPRMSALALMRDYLITVRQLVAGETVDYQGEVITLRGVKLAIDPPPRTPVYLGALGPQMLRLSGELADGVCMNWCTPEQIAWSRERIAEGPGRPVETHRKCRWRSTSVSAWTKMWTWPGGPSPGPAWGTPWASRCPRSGSGSGPWATGATLTAWA